MGCLRLDILDEQYYKTEFWDGCISKGFAPVQMRSEAIKNYEEQRDEYLAAEKRCTGATFFSAKTFSFGSFSFWSQKENEHYVNSKFANADTICYDRPTAVQPPPNILVATSAQQSVLL